MKRWGKWILPFAFALFSCSIITPAENSRPSSPEISGEDISEAASESEYSSPEASTSVEKDEQGFIILPDGYFEHETRPHSFGADVATKQKAPNMRLYLGDEQVPVYGVYVNQTRRWDPEAKIRDLSGVASVSISQGAKFSIATTWVVGEGRCKIKPLNKEVPMTFDEVHRVVHFEITEPGDYVIEYRGNRMLHLFVHPYEATCPYNESNSIYFGPGVHNKNNDSRLASNSTIYLSSNQTVYLAEGAFVEAAFVSTNSQNVKILGPGFIDGSVFDRNASKNTCFIPFDFTDCSGFLFSSFAVLDPAGWCFNLYFCHDFELNGVKVISSRSNGDGISLQSCRNALVDGCFTRTYDDSIVVKNYPRWNNRSVEGVTENIEVRNCLIWTDLAQCMEVGYETVGATMRQIYFHDNIVLAAYHKAVLSIHNANNANIRDVRFEDIIIENLQTGQGDGNPLLLEFTVAHSPTWSDQHKVTGLGDIDGVKVKNIKILSGLKSPEIIICGSTEERSAYPNVAHEIFNVSLDNLDNQGTRITKDYTNFTLAYAHNVMVDGTAVSL